ncbi:hypothetical protein C8R46DRAFT_990938 [Mycena filopes]|nr:hypothetical protein C8R46DRAFT_990938 [Mycena filopes]
MHRALTIAEIVQLILLQICPDPTDDPSKEETRDLATLAHTCKALSDPALDALWSCQDTYLNALKCMPPDVWSPAWVSAFVRMATLRRPIVRSDWDRVLPYLYRVRSFFAFESTLPANVDHAAVFEILRLALPFTHLFPHLRTLRWLFYPSTLLVLGPLLLTPTLTTVVLGTFENTSQFSMLPSLAVKCPLLTHVDISLLPAAGTDSSQAVASFISGLHRLESLDMQSLDSSAFAHLSTLPRLETLILATPDFDGPVARPPRSQPAFVALRDVTVNCATAQCAQTLIAALSYSPLHSLELFDIDPPPSARSVMQILRTLERHLPRTTLTRILLNNSRFDVEEEQSAVTIKAVRMLFRFRNLTFVQLQPASGIDVADDDILSLAHAWPHLETLSLRPHLNVPQNITLRGVLHLAEHCPKLQHLEMVIDASTVPPLKRSEHRLRPLRCALVYWQVGASAISSPLQVARFLSAIFPALRSVDPEDEDYDEEDDDDDELVELWREVNTALPICHEMREEERFWVRQTQGNANGRAGPVEV